MDFFAQSCKILDKVCDNYQKMSKEKPMIAVDMLGVDKGKPGKVECKALKGILKNDLFPEVEFILVGCREQIIKALKGLLGEEKLDEKTGKMKFSGRVKEIINAPERIDSNLKVLNKEKLKEARELNSGVKECYDLVSKGEADALVSCSHTGFQVHLASSKLGRMKLEVEGGGSIRPGLSIAATIPNPNEKTPTEFSDVGASLPSDNVFEKTQQLILKALMALPLGVISKKRINPKDPSRPKLFILSNGTEPEKAPKAVQYAHTVLEKFKDFFNYGGLTEPSFFQKKEDMEIVIDDGFAGNKELKTMEDEGKGMKKSIKDLMFGGVEISRKRDILKPRNLWRLRNIWRGLGYLMLRKVFKTFSPDNHAGGLIYGVNKIAVKSHGSSTPKAVTVAIGKTANFVKEDIVGQVQELFRGLPKEIAEVVQSTRKLAEILGMDGERAELCEELKNTSETAKKEAIEMAMRFLQNKADRKSTKFKQRITHIAEGLLLLEACGTNAKEITSFLEEEIKMLDTLDEKPTKTSPIEDHEEPSS